MGYTKRRLPPEKEFGRDRENLEFASHTLSANVFEPGAPIAQAIDRPNISKQITFRAVADLDFLENGIGRLYRHRFSSRML